MRGSKITTQWCGENLNLRLPELRDATYLASGRCNRIVKTPVEARGGGDVADLLIGVVIDFEPNHSWSPAIGRWLLRLASPTRKRLLSA